ncbi:HIT family protein [Conexivisphaera calida]|uniref:HIT family protein n=1 Tax=Conexivisphaera calida TaxID=1874277 RepID=UPI00157B617F|nr:HIT domain-containing protein [Conexivisphaera calida]
MPDDLFCRIARGEEPAHFVHEDEELMVIMDRYPVSRGQVLVVPRAHFRFFHEMPNGLVGHFYSVAAAAGRAINSLMSPDAVVMLARGLRIPHYHLMLIPARSGDFVSSLFSLMDSVQGFPASVRSEIAARYSSLGRALRVPEVSDAQLEEDARALGDALRNEIARA